jgi:dTDP-glucose 4,6-dehydratase
MIQLANARLLVTGGAGFIGQNFVHHLAGVAPNAHIVVLDALTYAANPAGLRPLEQAERITLVKGDITDLEGLAVLFASHRFDHVAHLAAESHVDRSITGPDAFIQTNIVGTYNLLKTALADWSQRGLLDRARFLHVSTDEVFGDLGPDEPPFQENTPYEPSSPYSASKAASDHLARAFCRTYGLPVLVTNCSNNYGPYQHPEKLIPLMVTNALSGKNLPLYGDGLNIRDWLYVGDHCKALAAVLERGAVGATYNIGGNSERTNAEVVQLICANIDAAFRAEPALASRYPHSPAAMGRSCNTLITPVADRLGHDRRYAIDCSFIRRSLGVSPSESFESGLARTVHWYIANEDWWSEMGQGG